jgi:PIN domain nuclease of toxin-antitoxin system
MPTTEAIILDTHAWKMYVDGDRFSRRVLRRIDSAANAGRLYVAAITIWEIAMLVHKGHLRLGVPTMEWVTRAIHGSRVVVHPLEPTIAVDSMDLGAFHGDPADRMIVATARHLNGILVTKDGNIVDYAEDTENVRVMEPT